MELICAPGGAVDVRWPTQGVGDLARAGFTSGLLDASQLCPPDELEAAGRFMRRGGAEPPVSENPALLAERADRLLAAYRARGLRVSVAYAPYLLGETKRAGELDALLERLAAESVRAAARAGVRLLVVRPIGGDGTDKTEVNRAFYLRLAALSEAREMTILLENRSRDVNGHPVRGFLSDGAAAASFIDELNEAARGARFGFCLDVGTASLCGQNVYDTICALGGRLQAVILRDTDGWRDDALLPFTAAHKGTSRIDWLNIIRGLRAVRFDGALILRIEDTVRAFSPLLREEVLRLAKKTGDYIVGQIGMERLLERYGTRVLFGAGNMCRNYMKCYGAAFPPLFTCDNDRARWGGRFCGLEVRPPEALQALPPDCAVFICNVYYREIEAQLRGMGLENPIEFFNDEYLPSFYFERVEDLRSGEARR